MKTRDHQELDVVSQTRSDPAMRAMRDGRGQCMPEFVARDLREAAHRTFPVQSL